MPSGHAVGEDDLDLLVYTMKIISEPLSSFIETGGLSKGVLVGRVEIQLEELLNPQFSIFWVAEETPSGRIASPVIVCYSCRNFVDELAAESTRPVLKGFGGGPVRRATVCYSGTGSSA